VYILIVSYNCDWHDRKLALIYLQNKRGELTRTGGLQILMGVEIIERIK
jgi:hypothetical protein